MFWFCSKWKKKVTQFEGLITELRNTISQKQYEIDKKIEQLRSSHGVISALHSVKQTLTLELSQATIETEELKTKIKTLESALYESINVPDVSPYVEPRGIVEPYEHPEIGRVENRKQVYDVEIRELEYHTFTKENWLSMLELVKTEVRRVLGTPSIPMSDCDNYTELTSAILHVAFLKAGLDIQGGICNLEMSGKHVYNGFIEKDTDTVWVYDSMKSVDPLIGVLGETTGLYVTTDIIFSG